jgi:ABC-type phosphate/phosphonate transport system substrate-binding protein
MSRAEPRSVFNASVFGASVASLAMYDFPELAAANDALWSAIAARLEDDGVGEVPSRLTREGPPEETWTNPALLLAQTCGYPLATSLQGRVQLVATPRYRALGCDGAFHRSAVVVRNDALATCLADLRGARCALNDRTSNSGMNLLRVEIAPLARGQAFFGAVTITGSHEASAGLVASGDADVAAIDCVTWAHLQRFRPATTKHLRVLMWTVRSPGLPLITGARTDAATRAALGRALDAVATDPALSDVRGELMLDGFNALPASQYHAILYLEQIAIAQGYARLA